jgi:hypothetical protein
MSLTSEEIVWRRLHALRLLGPPCGSPAEVVGRLGAVQAQDFGPAKWSVAQRASGIDEAAVRRAFDSGELLRTHVLRPTWHFVAGDDIRWLLAATAPRVQVRLAYRYRQLGLDEGTLARSEKVIAGALRGGGRMTRRDAGRALTDAGVAVDGQRLAHVLMNAELKALVCSGPLEGRQHTYMLLEERAPQAARLSRGEALTELARRYFSSHGPASRRDFATWASLTVSDAEAGLGGAAAQLRRDRVDGVELWSGAVETPPASSPAVHLVQGYDELVMGYSETKWMLAAPGSSWTPATPPVYSLLVLLDGRVAGYWRRRLTKRAATIDVALLEPFDAAQSAALEAEAARYGRFVGLAAELKAVLA